MEVFRILWNIVRERLANTSGKFDFVWFAEYEYTYLAIHVYALGDKRGCSRQGGLFMPLASHPLARIAKGNRDEWFLTPKNNAIGMREGQPLYELHRHLPQNLCWELATSQMTKLSRQVFPEWIKDNTLVIAIRALNLKSIQQFRNKTLPG